MTGRPPGAPRTLQQRFWEFVTVDRGCWLWRGTKDKDGYGVVSRGGYPVRAHRASWKIHFGDIPGGKVVCHTCDVRACVNPGHLWLGTHGENIRDRDRKGRHPAVKITELAAREIRIRVAAGETQRSVAESFGVDPSNVSNIVRMKTWRDL